MALGPGVYDDLCTYVRKEAAAAAAVVIVFRGGRGNGFSVQAEGPEAEEFTARLPAILEEMARQIRADARGAAN